MTGKSSRVVRFFVSKVPLLFAFVCGMLVGGWLYFVYLCNALHQTDELEFSQIRPSYFETDMEALIQIYDEEDVNSKRDTLIRFIWGSAGFPYSELPDDVQKGISDERYEKLDNLKQIDRIAVNMDWGIDSIAYHFVPIRGNGELVIYHQGHRGDFVRGTDVIAALLDKGYSVVGMSMPLHGLNSQPVVYLERFGRLKITSYEHLALLDIDDGHVVKFFLHPVAVVLNYALEREYEAVHMVGISGGGWTTTVYAALDPRVSHSYPVAGTLPIYLRSESPRDWGGYEQTIPELYRIANYPELYILGGHGDDRRQLQILNQYDSCCFAGIKYRTYTDTIRDRMTALGKGSFDVYLDASHREHKVSKQAIQVILKDLKTNRYDSGICP